MIAQAGAAFVSRGDNSGTHNKEIALWDLAGLEPEGPWYISAGQGMGAVLTLADEVEAYTLSDRATFLARKQEGLNLAIMVAGDAVLFNPYGVIAVNPERNPEVQAQLADQFIEWLISVETQTRIGTFGVEAFGAPLFTPNSLPWRTAQ